MDFNRLGVGERIAAVSGIALILIMFIFNWFGLEVTVDVGGVSAGAEGGSANAWESFGVIDIILLITVVAALALAYVKAASQEVNLPVALSVVVAALGILSVVLLAIRLISPPDLGVDIDGVDTTRKIGIWLGLIASIALAYGGIRAMQDEGTSFREAGGQLGGGGGAGPGEGPPSEPPPPPPPPPSGGTGGAPPAGGA